VASFTTSWCRARSTGRMTALLLLGLSVLGACVAPTPTPDPVTVSFAFPSSDIVHYSELIARFHEQVPHIRIQRKPLRGSEDLEIPLLSGRVDTFAIHTLEIYVLPELRAQGSILNLMPFVEQDGAFDLSDFYPAAVRSCMAEGKLWGVPGQVDFWVMYYNRGLFDRYGVPYPTLDWTWDDFVAAVLSIRHPDDDIFGCVADMTVFPFSLAYQHGGRLLDDWENPTHVTFDDPLAIDALQRYVDLLDREGAILTDAQAQDRFGGGPRTAIYRSRIGMWAGSYAERGGDASGQKWPVDWGVVPLPRDRQRATVGFVRAYAISAQAKHPEACWEWIKFLSKQTPPYWMPARRSVVESATYDTQVGADVAAAARAAIHDALILSPVQMAFEEAFAAYEQAVQDAVDGKLTADEAMRRAQRQSPIR
jgi:multiple sugar transport system substrate-binding protein